MAVDIEALIKTLEKHGTSWSVDSKLAQLGSRQDVAAAIWAARKAGRIGIQAAEFTLRNAAGAPETWNADDFCAFVADLQHACPNGVAPGGAVHLTEGLPGLAYGFWHLLVEKENDSAFGSAMREQWTSLPKHYAPTVAYCLVVNGQLPVAELPDDVMRVAAEAYLRMPSHHELPGGARWLAAVSGVRWVSAMKEVALRPHTFTIGARAAAAELLPHIPKDDLLTVLARLPQDTSSGYAEDRASPRYLPSDDLLEPLRDRVDGAWLEHAITTTNGSQERQPRNVLLMSYARRCVTEGALMAPSVDEALATFLDQYPIGIATNQEALVEALRALPEARLESLILNAKQDQWGMVCLCPTQKAIDHALARLATTPEPKYARYQSWGTQRFAPATLAFWKPSEGAEACWSWPFRAKAVTPALAQLEKPNLSSYCRYLLTVVLAVSEAPEALPALFDALDSRDESQRAVALFGLAKLGADACLPELQARVGSRKKEHREGAARVLAALPSRADCYALAAAQAKVERVAAIKSVLETVRPPKGEESSLVDQLIASDGEAWRSHQGDAKELVDAFRVAFASKKEGGAPSPKVVDARPSVLLGAVAILPVADDVKARWGQCPFWFIHDANAERSTLFATHPENAGHGEQTEPILEVVSESIDTFFATVESHIGATDSMNCGLHSDIDVALATQSFKDDGFRVVPLKRWPPRMAADDSFAEVPLWPTWVSVMETHGARADAQALTIEVVLHHSDCAWSMLDSLGDRALLLADALEARLASDWPKSPKTKGAKNNVWPASDALQWLTHLPLSWSGSCWVAALGLGQKESAMAQTKLKAAGKEALPYLSKGLLHAQAGVRRGALDVLDALRLPESVPALEAAAAAHPKEGAIRTLIAALKSSELNLEALPLGAPGDAVLDAALASLPCPPWSWAGPFESLPKLVWLGGATVSDAAAQWFVSAIGVESETQREPKLALIRARLSDASCTALLSALFTHGHKVEGHVRFLRKFAFAMCFLGDDAALDETARNLEAVVHIASGRHGRDALDGLARRGTPAALRALEWANRRSGSNTMRRRCGDALAEMARWRGLSTPELLDEALSDFGFDAKGELAFDLAGRVLTLKLGRDNAVDLLDAEGRVLKALPAARKTDDAEAYAQAKKTFSTLKKALATAHASQRKRLESYLASERTWFANAWRERFLGHALMRTYARSLLWEAIDERGSSAAKFIVMESDLMNADLDAVTLDSSWRIRLLHPLGVSAKEVAQWTEVFSDNQLLPLFAQLSRPTFARAASDTALIDDLPKPVSGPWMGAMDRCGYEQGPRGDGGNIYSTVRTLGRYIVTIEHDGYWPSDPTWSFEVKRIVLTEAGKAAPWSALSDVLASEIAYDLHRLTGALK